MHKTHAEELAFLFEKGNWEFDQVQGLKFNLIIIDGSIVLEQVIDN